MTTDALNVRKRAGEDSAVLFSLDNGRRVFVIGEPEVAGELRWYRVGIVGGSECATACEGIGWIATPMTGEPWVEEVEVDCPPSPMTNAELHERQPLEMLHCYGRNEIVVSGTVEHPCCGYVGPFVFKPGWLAHPFTPAFLFTGGFSAIGFRHRPDIDLAIPDRGDIVSVTGHFEDPAAATCRENVGDLSPGDPDPSSDLPDPALVVLNCRATFVWTDYEVTGHEDLGPCCGSLSRGPMRGRPAGRERLPDARSAPESLDRPG